MAIDPLILVRAIHFAATMLASGIVGFIVLVAEPAAGVVRFGGFSTLRRWLTGLVWLALTVAVLSGALWLVLLASDLLGASIADICLHGGAWPVITDTRFGLVWCARLGLALLLGLLMPWPSTRWLQIATAVALLALPALVGHAGATPGLGGDLHLASDLLHLLAAGAWLGSLAALVLLLWQVRRAPSRAADKFAAQTVRRFSILGMASVAALVASGIVNSWSLLGSPRDLVTTDYGRLVALKIALFTAMVAIAAVNKFHLTARLPAKTAMRMLQRNSVAEIGLGACVLFLVGMLGTLSPAAHVHAAPVGIPPDAAFVHIHAAEAMADVTIDPGHTGHVDVTIRVSREDFSPFPAKDVRFALDPPAGTGRSVERAAVKQTDGAWLVNGMTLAQPGIWTARVMVRPGQGEPIVLDAPVVIER